MRWPPGSLRTYRWGIPLGGIDSSAIVALMQTHTSESVRTFTVGFDDPSFDESSEAAAVAAHLGTNHTASMLVTPRSLR